MEMDAPILIGIKDGDRVLCFIRNLYQQVEYILTG